MTVEADRAQILALIEQIDETDIGPQERALIDQGLRLAQDIGDERLEYDLRLRLTSSAAWSGDNDAMLSSFAWCLGRHQADPITFPGQIDGNAADLMWQFKWIIGALDASPIFSLAQCAAVLDDMERQYRAENLGLSGVLTARFQHAWAVGDIAEANRLRTQLLATPRDDHSHCDACSRSELAGFAAEFGQEELALSLLDEIIEGGFSCAREPENALSRTLVAQLRAGRVAEAIDAHMRSYRLARRNPDNISIVADNMVFCAMTGNEARGLAMVERHLPWLAHDTLNEAGQLNLLDAIGAVGAAVVAAGHGDQIVRGADADALTSFLGPHDGPWTVSQLVPVVNQATDRLAVAFNARNGNDYSSKKLAQRRATAQERYDAPLASDVFVPPAATPDQPTTPAGWLELAEVCQSGGQVDQADAAAERARQADDPAVRVRALQILIWNAPGRLDQPTASSAEAAVAELMAERQAALRAAGRPAQADLEQRLGLALLDSRQPGAIEALTAERARRADQPDDVLGDVEISLAQALMTQTESPDLDVVTELLQSGIAHASPQPRLQTSGLVALMNLYIGQGWLDQAVVVAEQGLALALPDGLRANFLVRRANLLGGLERYAEGAADADAATAVYASYDCAAGTVNTTLLAAALLRDAGRPEEALGRLRYALRQAERLDWATTVIRYRLGRALLTAGHPQEAVEVLWEVLHDEEAAEVGPADRAETCLGLAEGFEATDHYGNAANMYQQAAELYQAGDQPVAAANMWRRQGNLLRWFEMYDQSLEVLAKAQELLQEQNAPGMEVQVLEAIGFTKGEAGDASGPGDIDRAIAIVTADPTGPYPWKIADLTDSKARVLAKLEQHDAAVAGFLTAADGYAAAEDAAGAARAVHWAAQSLAGPLERPEEAIVLYRQGLAHVAAARQAGRDVGDLGESIQVKLAEALDATGRAAEAAAVRAELAQPDQPAGPSASPSASPLAGPDVPGR